MLVPQVYIPVKKMLNLTTKNKIHLKCDCINGSFLDKVNQTFLLSFVLDKPLRNKVFCEPETIHCKKLKISVLNTVTL